ncbi:MAG: hypothetical protein JW798_08510 [Prolixibacteraceae bacterium]|nr:hypothetical protein [Prolixibacteraceae bacterium]
MKRGAGLKRLFPLVIIDQMKKVLPACYGKCNKCFFYYINGCVALSGEDCFLEINSKHASLIAHNHERFNIHKDFSELLKKRFPEVESPVEF